MNLPQLYTDKQALERELTESVAAFAAKYASLKIVVLHEWTDCQRLKPEDSTQAAHQIRVQVSL